MKFIKQISEYHCVPAVLQGLLYDECPFTQEEIGFMIDTTEEGTYVENVHHFLLLMGYKLRVARPDLYVMLEPCAIVDYIDSSGDDHWGILKLLTKRFAIVYDPYTDTRTFINRKKINKLYRLEKLGV
jgi:hypothetical protein